MAASRFYVQVHYKTKREVEVMFFSHLKVFIRLDWNGCTSRKPILKEN